MPASIGATRAHSSFSFTALKTLSHQQFPFKHPSSAAPANMPSRRRSTDERSKYEASALDCIFACGVCQATVPEVYSEGHSHGLNSGDSHQEAAVTKIWIADCSHVFCGKHLEGGGQSLEHTSTKAFNSLTARYSVPSGRSRACEGYLSRMRRSQARRYEAEGILDSRLE